jgi:hypothetical protein
LSRRERWQDRSVALAVVAAGNRDALQGAGAVILALRFAVLKGAIDEIAGPLSPAGSTSMASGGYRPGAGGL